MGVVVREKNPGEWWIFINYNGRRKSRKIGVDKDKALEVAEKVRSKLALGEVKFKEKPSPVFRVYADKWLAMIKSTKRSSTYECYSGHLRRNILPKMGQMRLQKIKRADIKELFLDAHKRGLAKHTIGVLKNALSGVMNYALDAELIPANPVKGILRGMAIEKGESQIEDPLNWEEVNLFLKTCRAHHPELHVFFLTAFRTGLREGEILALGWSDIDWNGRFIRVSRSYRRGETTGTKTNKTRKVDISDDLFDEMRHLYTLRKEEGLKMGLGDAPKVIFHRDGNPMEQNYVRRKFKWILQKAGLRGIRFHDIRHTFASLLLSDGVSPVYVSKMLGHSTIQMTVDVYGHWIQNEHNREVNRLDEKFGRQTRQADTLKMHPDSALQAI